MKERKSDRLDYGFWYDVAKYGNENWKGCFSEKEIAENAYTYKCEYDWSKANNSLSEAIKRVIELLHDDNNDEANYFIGEIEYDMEGLLDE